MTLSEYRAMLLARRRTLLEDDPHSDFRGLPRAEIAGRLAELRNALDMLGRVEAAATVPATGHPNPEFATRDLGRPEPPPEAISLAPSWGVSCPHCGARLHLGFPDGMRTGPHIGAHICRHCWGLYREPAGALTADEARRVRQ